MAHELKCFICNERDSTQTLFEVKGKGLQTILECSKLREDGKSPLIMQLTSVRVHQKCRKTYTRRNSITADLKRKERDEASTSTDESTWKKMLRSEKELFDFRNTCFFCKGVIDNDFYKTQKKRPQRLKRIVCTVKKQSLLDYLREVAKKRNDEWGREVAARISTTLDLVSSKAVYHRDCYRRWSEPIRMTKQVGRPLSNDISSSMQIIFDYLENSEECQFSINELIDLITDSGHEAPSMNTVKTKLKEKYGDEIIMTVTHKQIPTLCFKNTGYAILSDTWYESRVANDREEKNRVIRKAAEIIRADIRGQFYDTSMYPDRHAFLANVDDIIPESLTLLLQEIITKKRKPTETLQKKCTTIAHSIISATRPRSFLSPIQLSIGAYIYKKIGSKSLIDILSKLGICVSYSDVRVLESSLLMAPKDQILPQSFCQFVFDNTDFNINTIDGLNTFHSMGGIQCVTPASAILQTSTDIDKVKVFKKSSCVEKKGVVELQIFEEKCDAGLKSFIFKNLNEELKTVVSCDRSIEMPTNSDVLWMCAKYEERPNIPGWRGFHERLMSHKTAEVTKVLFLPFINAPPSNYDTVYTALLMAVKKSEEIGLKTTIVTFDQPLYIKARDIVACAGDNSNLRNVVVRLGGFHILMSFLGTIGFIMAGSGLKDLLALIYAPNSVDKMLQGHAYARAVRGHLLVQLALAKIVLKSVPLTPVEQITVAARLIDFENHLLTARDIDVDPILTELSLKLEQQFLEIENYGPTAKLWMQYFHMITIIKLFIQAEREGNWKKHLLAVRRMVPFFHASGHFHYAKSCQIYLQDMVQLQSKLDVVEYEMFCKRGYFTMKRTKKFWTGTWSDQTIEQTLNREFKIKGGPVMRGITDETLTSFVITMPILHDICASFEEYCKVQFTSGEQHVEARETRMQRDDEDVKKLGEWLETHNPFEISNEIMSLSSGVIGDQEIINCFLARENGESSMDSIIDKSFKDVHMKRSNRVQSLAAVNSSIKVHDKRAVIDPLMIFQRIIIAKKKDEDLPEFLQYELAPFPLSLFCEAGMRKTNKSAMYKIFQECTETVIPEVDTTYVIDGGFLLHRVLWSCNKSYRDICSAYVNYVQKHYGDHCVIVFDGYDNAGNSTKRCEQHRRSAKKSCSDIIFQEHMVATVTQEQFLRNGKNKMRLISMLKDKFEDKEFAVRQAESDADVLIVSTAIEISATRQCAIVGEDVDLLVLTVALAPVNNNIFFLKPGKGKTERQIYSSQKLQEDEYLKETILLAHAFSGCDTTSAIFQKGKNKIVNLLQRVEELRHVNNIFVNSNSTAQEIQRAGEILFLYIYGAKHPEKINLNVHRYNEFKRFAQKSTSRMPSLPPTEGAAAQHSFRAYHQVQTWLGNYKDPEMWGWHKVNNYLQPLQTLESPAPDEILRLVSCNCKKHCTMSCGCKKAGLKCSDLCGNCQKTGCLNIYELDEEVEEDIDTF